MALDPVDGGNGNVNGDFKILSQQPSILVQSDGSVVDAVTVRARELAYDVEFTFTKSTATWQGALFETETRVLAADIQTIAGHPHVQALYSAQDTDRNGFLRDYLFVTVGTDDGENEATVKVLQDNANTTAGYAAIDKAYNTLIANLGLGS